VKRTSSEKDKTKQNFVNFNVEIDSDLYNYLEFLEQTQFINNKNEALHKSLLMFKKLSMHDWLPDIYRFGEKRAIIMDKGMLLDLFEFMSDFEIYRIGSTTALKRKILKPEFRDINLTNKRNWPIVFNELHNLGWGNFECIDDEIKVVSPAIPIPYLRGYLETMLKVKLVEHKTRTNDISVFKVSKPILEAWL